MQLAPHPALTAVVRHYLILEGMPAANGIHRLFADGNTGLVFNLSLAALCSSTDKPSVHASWLYGQVKTYHDLSLAGSINWIVVVLQPYGAYQLWGVPGTEWYNCFFPAAQVLGARINNIAHALTKAKYLPERIRLLDNFLLQQMTAAKSLDPMIVLAVQHIMLHEGSLPVEALLQRLSVNERMLERKFKLQIGVSPKRFSDIVRLNISTKRMQQLKATRRLTAIAYDSGYFDQAHFIKEFKKYTGITPQQYHTRAHPLALNFLQL